MGPGKDPSVNSGGALRRRAAGSAATLSLGARASRPETCMALRGEECGAPAGIPAATSRPHHSLKSMV